MAYCLRFALLVCFLTFSAGCSDATSQDSGGPLPDAQAAYDVTFYDLSVAPNPETKTLDGTLTAVAAVKSPIEAFVLNLDRRLTVDAARLMAGSDGGGTALTVDRRGETENEVWIMLPEVARPGDTLRVAVEYSGTPRVAPRPPWDGGFTWGQTPDGQPWFATSCQTAGADLWWPVKDHPSDEPDSMAIHVTVPKPLVVASNGVLRGVDDAGDARTYRWFVSTPINTYAAAIHVAPYAQVDTTYTSVTGMDVPVTFFALPSDSSRARSALPHFLDHVRFLEETLGPYPFRADKYGIAQTPYKGMEHQTIIAYGNDFNLQGGLYYDAGFDALHFHEVAHEWYGNLVTVSDWKDFWIHEGFATYLEALYRESLQGADGYFQTIDFFRGQITNRNPVARTASTSAQGMYGGDVYYKGAVVLHTLRYVVGDDTFREILRTFTYPTEVMREATGGSQTRHVSTADFVTTAEEVSGRQLDGFFSVYLYQAELPVLRTERTGDALTLTWENTGGMPFAVPVPVEVNGEVQRVAMDGGSATVNLPPDASVAVDPNGWVLKAVTDE